MTMGRVQIQLHFHLYDQHVQLLGVHQLWRFFKPKLRGEGRERKKIKIVVPFRSVPTQRVIENSKKIASKFNKIKKYHYAPISSQNRLEKAEKSRN